MGLKRILTSFILAAALAFAGAAHAQEKPPLALAFEKLLAGENALARGLIEPLAAEGDRDAQHMLGYMEERGLGGPRNMKRALELYAASAASGSPDAQFALGELAFLGDGVKRDYKRAAGWFTLASDQGHVQSKVRLGAMYAEGLGFDADPLKAIEFFEQAATLGDPGAQYNMGVAYLVGQGVGQDYKKSADWFLKSAEQGSPDAQYNLALLYDTDYLGDPQPQETVRWMQAAAEGGLPAAFVALGLMVHDGRVQSENEEQKSVAAADWFEKAARAGEPQGQYLYAVSLAEGDGREADPAQALIWLDRAMSREGALLAPTLASAEELHAELQQTLAAEKALRQ